MHKIINFNVLQNYQVKLKFDDGQQGIADLSHLVGKGVFSSWNDYNTFQNVKIGSSGELVWSDQIDICPDSLYLKITNQKPEDLFPNLKHNELGAVFPSSLFIPLELSVKSISWKFRCFFTF
jgi:hypothetical protein